MKMKDELLDKSVLVYGPRKAGTTLLQNLLDGGKQILMIPVELKIKFMYKKIFSDQFEKKSSGAVY